MTLAKGQCVTVEDVFSGDRPAELTLMFAEMPGLEAGRIVLPELATIAGEGAGPARLEAFAIADPRLRLAWPETLYRVLLPLAGERLTLTIR